MPQKEDLRTVAWGLQLVYAGLIVIVLTVIVGFALGMYSPGRVALLALGGRLISSLLDIIGKIRCLAVPEKLRVSGIVYNSMGCTVAGYVLILVGRSLPPFEIANGADSLGELLLAAAYVLFLIFLQRLAEFIGSPRLARKAKTILIVSIVLGLLWFGSLGAVLLVAAIGRKEIDVVSWIGPLWLMMGIAWLVLFITYANLITYLRRATLQYVESQALA
jgi:hypothetical protein